MLHSNLRQRLEHHRCQLSCKPNHWHMGWRYLHSRLHLQVRDVESHDLLRANCSMYTCGKSWLGCRATITVEDTAEDALHIIVVDKEH